MLMKNFANPCAMIMFATRNPGMQNERNMSNIITTTQKSTLQPESNVSSLNWCPGPFV